jgi:hypothetical protein
MSYLLFIGLHFSSLVIITANVLAKLRLNAV